MKLKPRPSRVAVLLAIAVINLSALIISGRFADIRTVDALRLLLSGILIGVAIGLAVAGGRLNRTA
jgi:hypothetical protein